METSRFDTIARLFAERRLSRASPRQGAGGLGAGTLVTAGLAQAVSAQDATPAAETDHPSFLFVQSFGTGAIAAAENGTLTLTADHLTGQTIFFSDRPERIVGTVPTEDFLGLDRAPSPSATPGSSDAIPEGGIGFTPANPPNAALVFDSAGGSDAPGDVVVVELINPTYDRATGQATYEITVLADETAVDLSLCLGAGHGRGRDRRLRRGEPVHRRLRRWGHHLRECRRRERRPPWSHAIRRPATAGIQPICAARPCAGMEYWSQQCY